MNDSIWLHENMFITWGTNSGEKSRYIIYIIKLYNYLHNYHNNYVYIYYIYIFDMLDATVYVGGLDEKVSESVLWELFLQAGPVGQWIVSIQTKCWV